MLPVKLVRSLILNEPINTRNHHHNSETKTSSRNRRRLRRKQSKAITSTCQEEDEEDEEKNTKKTPLLVFMPSKELISNTYRLASLARDIGMDLHPTPSLSHIIFTYPSSSSSSSSPSSSWSTTSLSSSLWSLPNDAVPLPFPSFAASSLALLRSFVGISKGLFKLVFVESEFVVKDGNFGSVVGNWDCCTLSLFSRGGCGRIESMDGFSRALAGLGWTLFKTGRRDSAGDGKDSVYLFRKVDLDRVRLRISVRGFGDGDLGGCRIRELRLPHLDFSNAPLRILQYILLMTDDAFYLA